MEGAEADVPRKESSNNSTQMAEGHCTRAAGRRVPTRRPSARAGRGAITWDLKIRDRNGIRPLWHGAGLRHDRFDQLAGDPGSAAGRAGRPPDAGGCQFVAVGGRLADNGTQEPAEVSLPTSPPGLLSAAWV